MQTIGQLNMPVGLTFDSTALPNMRDWKLNLDPAQRVNGAAIVNVWMTQVRICIVISVCILNSCCFCCFLREFLSRTINRVWFVDLAHSVIPV